MALEYMDRPAPTAEDLHHGRIEQRLLYQTEDGQTFDTLDEAQQHDDALVLAGQIDDALSDLGISDADLFALAMWILNNFTRKD